VRHRLLVVAVAAFSTAGRVPVASAEISKDGGPKPTIPAPTVAHTNVTVQRIEPARAPAEAVVELVAAKNVNLDAIASAGGYVRINDDRVELFNIHGSTASIKLPSWEELGPHSTYAEVRLVAVDNTSRMLKLSLISEAESKLRTDEPWKVVSIGPTGTGDTLARVQLDRLLPVQYWGKAKLLFGGAEVRIVKFQAAAIDVEIPQPSTSSTNIQLFVGDLAAPAFSMTPPPSSAADAKVDQELAALRAKLLETEKDAAARAADQSRAQAAVKRLSLQAGLAGAVGVPILMAFLWWRERGNRRREAERRAELAKAQEEMLAATAAAQRARSDAAVVSSKELPASTPSHVPEVPPELAEACANGNCVVYVGDELAAQAGLPTFSQLLTKLAERFASALDELRPTVKAAARRSNTKVAELIRGRVALDDLRVAVIEELARASRHESSAHTTLAALPLAGIVTTSWDTVLDEVLRSRDAEVMTPKDGERVSNTLSSSQPFLFKLLGDPARPGTFSFTHADLETALYENDTALKSLSGLLLSKTFLFVGASIEDIEAFLSLLRLRSNSSQHFALVPADDETPLDESRLRSRHGIQLLAYGRTSGDPEVVRFLSDLHDAVTRKGPVEPNLSRSLSRVVLENIGPFASLDLRLTKEWNVLLGNNGCGKSTVLRAIAVGLCGADAKLWKGAGALLQTGKNSGSIQLEIGVTTFRTDLVRDGDKVDVRSTTITPLQSKQWVAIGFPPLRGSSLRESTGPSVSGSRYPQVDDLEPLIVGGADSRMDDLKQWVINLSVAAEGTNQKEAAVAAATRSKVFEILGALTPGVSCRFSRLDRRNWQVWVQTEDAEIPFGLVSQGTHSVFGWVGALLLRLYETRQSPDSPESSAALVLVDEIDAHMHPEWQQKLVPALRKLMPELQVVATTHSPLIVGSMQPGEVTRFLRRDDASLDVATLDARILNFRADQILTSPAYSLASTRAGSTEDMIERYTSLLSKKEPDDKERQELEELGRKLGDVLSPGETALQRDVGTAVEATLDLMSSTTSIAQKPELAPALELEVKRQLQELLAPKHAGPAQDSHD
jgi:hypothetical protein